MHSVSFLSDNARAASLCVSGSSWNRSMPAPRMLIAGGTPGDRSRDAIGMTGASRLRCRSDAPLVRIRGTWKSKRRTKPFSAAISVDTIATNSKVFPYAAYVVTLVDRVLHRAEVIEIDGESYRLK